MTRTAVRPKQKSKPKIGLKRLIMVTSDKGGTGKSTFSRGLLDVWIERQLGWAAYDGDARNPQLYRHYRSVGAGVVQLDITKQGGADVLLDDMERDDLSVMLVDLPAGSGPALERFDTETGFFEACQEMGYEITFVSVLSRVKDSVNALRLLMDLADGRASHVAVKNLHFGSPEKFTRFEQSRTRERLLASGGLVLNMPELFDDTYDLVDESSLRFRVAAGEESSLKRSHRARVFQWLKAFEAEMEGAQALLGLGE